MGKPWSSSNPSSHVSLDEENLSDRAIMEKIQLLESKIASGIDERLPDRGIKLHARLDSLRQKLQLKRGRDEGAPKDVVEWSAKMDRTPYEVPAESSDPISKSLSTCRSLKSPNASFHQSLESKEENSNEEADMVGRMSPASCPTPAIKNVERNPYRNPLFAEDRRMMTRSSKRKKALETIFPRHGEWTEVQTVVLLDEEDELVNANPVKEKLDKWKGATIHYPSRDHPESVEICYSDVKCLDPESYLSSTIMNFYIQYLHKTISPSSRLYTECHFFNTYFYRKLEEAVTCKVDRKATFSKLRRWLKGVNLFEKAYIFLPVHGELHWSLVIICIPSQEDEAGPIILHLDSLGFHDGNRIFRSIESYLREEWENICRSVSLCNVPISEKVWGELPHRIKKRKIMVPQQKNDYDCGLFVLYFIQRFIEEAPERLKKKDLAMFGSKWFQPEEASGLRRRIRELLVEEFKRARQERESLRAPNKQKLAT